MAEILDIIKKLEALAKAMRQHQCWTCSHEFIDAANEFSGNIITDAIEGIKEQNYRMLELIKENDRLQEQLKEEIGAPFKMMTLVELTGAKCVYEDDGKLSFAPWNPIWINPEQICGLCDHTILINGQKIRVMETDAQIVEALRPVAYVMKGVALQDDKPEQDADTDRI